MKLEIFHVFIMYFILTSCGIISFVSFMYGNFLACFCYLCPASVSLCNILYLEFIRK